MLPDPQPYPAVAGKPVHSQQVEYPVLTGVEARLNVGDDVTPVFGTSVPPRGLSGVIRRAGYKYPEHHAARWMILILGDRVDVWESRLRRNPLKAGLALAGIFWLLRARRA
jgi:hypothetical protein